MIEKAYVSGQIGQAIFKEEDKCFVLNAKDTKRALECTPYEMNLFFNIDAEIKIFENINFDDLRKKFLKEKACFDALYGAIGGFDPDLSEETRIHSIQRAEKLIEDPEIFDFVKSRFFGNPVPKKAALKTAVELSIRNNCKKLNFTYQKLSNHRKVINHILSIFKETIFELSLEKDFVKIKNTFTTTGIFAQLFLSTTNKNLKKLNQLVHNFSNVAKLKEGIPLISQILIQIKLRLKKQYELIEIQRVSIKKSKRLLSNRRGIKLNFKNNIKPHLSKYGGLMKKMRLYREWRKISGCKAGEIKCINPDLQSFRTVLGGIGGKIRNRTTISGLKIMVGSTQYKVIMKGISGNWKEIESPIDLTKLNSDKCKIMKKDFGRNWEEIEIPVKIIKK